MEIKWTSKAVSDLARLHDFLATANPAAAARTVKQLVTAATRLLANPHIGEMLDEFQPREVRRILVGRYELRYELVGSTLYVLRLWHTREER